MKKSNDESEVLNRIFHALSDPTRREILDILATRECTISELAEPFKMTFAAVSKHIKVLEAAGLISREVDGRVHRCSADLEALQPVSTFVEKYKQYWTKQFDILEKYLEEKKNES